MITCDDARNAAPELALGTLDGGQRAELLRHLSVCPACRDETARLVETAEAIGLLAAPVLPPVGFEDRVLAVMGTGTAAPPRPRRRRWLVRSLVVAAAAVIGVLLAVGAIALSRHDEPSVASAPMIAPGGFAVGTAYVSPGRPALVVVKVEYPYPGGTYHLEAIGAGGVVDTLGNLVEVNGAWRWSGLADEADVRTLRVVDADGNVTCEAHLT
jgi:anti-sigma factor RsiW